MKDNFLDIIQTIFIIYFCIDFIKDLINMFCMLHEKNDRNIYETNFLLMNKETKH